MWEQFFLDFFDRSAEALGIVLRAWACREGWLQGELYRAGHAQGLRVNEYRLGRKKKADVCCLVSPRMVAEVKIIGADYDAKMRYYLDADIERLMAIDDEEMERYMLLVIPHSEVRTSLGTYLEQACYSSHCAEREYPQYRLRLWRIYQSAAVNPVE